MRPCCIDLLSLSLYIESNNILVSIRLDFNKLNTFHLALCFSLVHLFLRDDASDNSSFLNRCIFETKVRIYIELTNKKVKKVLIKYIPN